MWNVVAVGRQGHRQLSVYFIPACESVALPHLHLKASDKDLAPVWIMCHLISESVTGKGDGGGQV